MLCRLNFELLIIILQKTFPCFCRFQLTFLFFQSSFTFLFFKGTTYQEKMLLEIMQHSYISILRHNKVDKERNSGIELEQSASQPTVRIKLIVFVYDGEGNNISLYSITLVWSDLSFFDF